MSKFERGPAETYEVIWNSGHVEYLDAHQVLLPPDENFFSLGRGIFGSTETQTKPSRGWVFHAEIEGRWTLLLAAPAEDIKSVRNVTHTRDSAGGTSCPPHDPSP